MMDTSEETLEERYYDWSLLKRILSYLKPYRSWVVVAVFLLLGVSLLQLVGPYLTKIVIDDYIRVSSFEGLNTIGMIFLLVLMITFVFQFFQTLLMQYIGQKVMVDLRRQVFAHLHRMTFLFFDKNPIGKMITRVVNDVEVLNEMLTSGLILIFSDLFTLSGILLMLLYLDWRLTLIVCLIFFPLGVATQVYRNRARDALRKNRAHITGLNSFLQENLSGMDTVQIFGCEELHAERFRKINADKLNEDLRSIHYNAIYLPSIDIFSAVGIGVIVWHGGGKFIQNEIQLGVLVAFLQYLQKFFDPIRDLAEKFNIIQSAMASSERIFELLDTPCEKRGSGSGSVLIKEFHGHIEFQNVWFAYKNEDYVLKDVSFGLGVGESLAIVGATGSGKTSIINALCSFYEIQKGEIKVDGRSLQSLDKQALRRQIALIQQDPFLFSGNILDNIRLGNNDLKLDDVKDLSRSINLHEFIDNLPEKYEHKVKENGASLSMGQKQLLVFARALAFDPKILILDEATSNVDTETEFLIQEAVRKLIHGRTSITIAHRLSTLRNVDKVLVLKKGRVQEFGKRRELLNKRGIFYQLVNIQAKALNPLKIRKTS